MATLSCKIAPISFRKRFQSEIKLESGLCKRRLRAFAGYPGTVIHPRKAVSSVSMSNALFPTKGECGKVTNHRRTHESEVLGSNLHIHKQHGHTAAYKTTKEPYC